MYSTYHLEILDCLLIIEFLAQKLKHEARQTFPDSCIIYLSRCSICYLIFVANHIQVMRTPLHRHDLTAF